jgi:DNA-binding LacI/PurR family transcriptional regulator/DNA-binding transcriptional regulator YhcF (GntR family)
MRVNTESYNRAYNFLSKFVEEQTALERTRLPIIKRLAAAAHVAQDAMSAAVARMRDDGILLVSRKHGIRLARSIDIGPAETAVPRWMQTRVRLERDILGGAFRRETALPRLSELGERYGVGFPSIKRAVTALVKDHVVTRYKRMYRIAAGRPRKLSATVLFISRGDKNRDNLVLFSDRVREYDYSLIKEAASASVSIVKVPIDPLSSVQSSVAALKSFYNRHAVIGAVIWKDCFQPELYEMLCGECVNRQKPVAVIDEEGNYRRPPFSAAAGIKCFTIASALAGRSVARLLINAGHRAIAFVSTSHSASWSLKRRQGLIEAFSEAGFPGAVRSFGADITVSPADLEAIEFAPQCNNIERILNKIWVSSERFSRTLQTVAMFGTMMTMLSNEALYRKLVDWFARIAADRNITALAASTDLTAILAMDYFSRKPKQTPRKMAIIGFDDSREAHEYAMSSYNFNFGDIARMSLSYILNPRHYLFRDRDMLECEGIIMERKSTGTSA